MTEKEQHAFKILKALLRSPNINSILELRRERCPIESMSRFATGLVEETLKQLNPETEEVAEGDWVPYDGGGMPCGRSEVVDVKFRDGLSYVNYLAVNLHWYEVDEDREEEDGDIVEWRKCK